MKVTCTDGVTFTLQAETLVDQQLVDALYYVAHVSVAGFVDETRLDDGGAVKVRTGVQLHMSIDNLEACLADAGRNVARAIAEAMRLMPSGAAR